MLTKKRYTLEDFELTESARNAFYLVKDLLGKSAKRANMNPSAVKNLEALDAYSQADPHLNLG